MSLKSFLEKFQRKNKIVYNEGFVDNKNYTIQEYLSIPNPYNYFNVSHNHFEVESGNQITIKTTKFLHDGILVIHEMIDGPYSIAGYPKYMFLSKDSSDNYVFKTLTEEMALINNKYQPCYVLSFENNNGYACEQISADDYKMGNVKNKEIFDSCIKEIKLFKQSKEKTC